MWYLKAKELLEKAGWEELKCARAVFVVRDKQGQCAGMLVLHVDDACYGGAGPEFDKVLRETKKSFVLGAEGFRDFEFLGRHVVQR